MFSFPSRRVFIRHVRGINGEHKWSREFATFANSVIVKYRNCLLSHSGPGNWQSQTPHILILYPSIHACTEVRCRTKCGKRSAKKASRGVCKARMYARPDNRKRSFRGRRYRILVGWWLLKITWSLLSAAFSPIPNLIFSKFPVPTD